MISIDCALDIYMDKLNNNEAIDLNYFENNLRQEDYEEFLEIISVINLCKSNKITENFEKVFKKINDYKNNLYEVKAVANFRSHDECSEDESKKILDEIFDEEFYDE